MSRSRSMAKVALCSALALAASMAVTGGAAAATRPVGWVTQVNTGAYVVAQPFHVLRSGSTLVVADYQGYKILAFTLNASGDAVTGAPTVVAGDGTPCEDPTSGCGDGGPATSAQILPLTIATAADGVLIADQRASRIRKVYTSGAKQGTIESIAGNGTPGYSGDGGLATAAQISFQIGGIVVGPDKNVYFSDSGNNRIRCIGCMGAGVISTVVGTGKAAGTGPGQVATASGDTRPNGKPLTASTVNLFGPFGVTFDKQNRLVFASGCDLASVFASGDLAVAPSYCDATVRRVNNVGKIKPGDTITRLAGVPGTVGATNSGDARQRRLPTPVGLAYRSDGRLYVSTFGGTFVQYLKVVMGQAPPSTLSPSIVCVDCAGTGKVSLVAGGNPAGGAPGNNGAGRSASLASNFLQPRFSGDLYFADPFNAQVRRIRC